MSLLTHNKSIAASWIALLVWHTAAAAAEFPASPEGVVMPTRGICAHRGASATHPENTLAAFAEAIRLGVHQIELDVRLSQDGRLVVIHDASVDRTTNGRGKVADMTLAEVRQLDAGSWKDVKFADERIPTLAEALAIMPRNVWLNLHLRGGAPIGKAVALDVIRHKRKHQAFLACGLDAASAAREVDAEIMICNMDRQEHSARYVDACIQQDCQFVQLLGGIAPRSAMRRLEENGLIVNYCCTNDPATLPGLFAVGIDFALVDDVAPMIEQAQKLGAVRLRPVYLVNSPSAE